MIIEDLRLTCDSASGRRGSSQHICLQLQRLSQEELLHVLFELHDQGQSSQARPWGREAISMGTKQERSFWCNDGGQLLLHLWHADVQVCESNAWVDFLLTKSSGGAAGFRE